MMSLDGCSSNSMVDYEVDSSLPKIGRVEYTVGSSEIGFEWKAPFEKGLDGINIYRSRATPNPLSYTTRDLIKIATIDNPYISHYVDRGLKQNSYYTYTFTTIKGGLESLHDRVIDIKTAPPLSKIEPIDGTQIGRNVIKLTWRVHPDMRVDRYRVERSINGDRWYLVGVTNSRMMVEFIDSPISLGDRYEYRVIAVGFDGSYSIPSNIVTILTK